MSEGYIDYAQKCDVIFQAQRDIALQIPDVTDQDIQDIKYTGSGATMQAVSKAKDKIKHFRRRTTSTGLHLGLILFESSTDPGVYLHNIKDNDFTVS
jgi:hypothetical protein